MMKQYSRPRWVLLAWFLWTIFCGILLIAGGAVLGGWLYLARGWSRYLIGLALLTGGGLAAYFGTLRFFWYVVGWLSRGKNKNGSASVKGPKVVVVGGGTGLGTILRGLKEITSNLTAIVTVADDGGSSGRLRQEFGILPPGDIRNCLVAMADLEPLMEKLMQYRFEPGTVFEGHSFGNLFLTVMTNVSGDFVEAIKESSKVLAVRGQVLPATLEQVGLKADYVDGSVVRGESAIPKLRRPIERIHLEPENIKPVGAAITAIAEADIILLGPGSLFTSIIPNLLVEDIAKAIHDASAIKVYICNAMTQPGETDDYTASQHVEAIIKHAGKGLIDLAIVNTGKIPENILGKYAEEGGRPVVADLDRIKGLGISPIGVDIVSRGGVIRHDAAKLAALVDELVRNEKIEKAFGKSLVRKIYHFFKRIQA